MRCSTPRGLAFSNNAQSGGRSHPVIATRTSTHDRDRASRTLSRALAGARPRGVHRRVAHARGQPAALCRDADDVARRRDDRLRSDARGAVRRGDRAAHLHERRRQARGRVVHGGEQRATLSRRDLHHHHQHHRHRHHHRHRRRRTRRLYGSSDEDSPGRRGIARLDRRACRPRRQSQSVPRRGVARRIARRRRGASSRVKSLPRVVARVDDDRVLVFVAWLYARLRWSRGVGR